MSESAAVPVSMMNIAGTSFDGGFIEIRDAAINVEEVMARIRQSIEEKKKSRIYHEDVLLAQGTDLFQPGESSRNMTDHLALLKYVARIDLEGEQITSHRAFVGLVIKLAKRFARFWIRKYTDGIFIKQDHFNAEVIAVLSELSQRLEKQEAENKQLREQLEALSRR